MRFTEAERAKRYREGKVLRGIKTLRFDVDISKVSEEKVTEKVKELIKSLEDNGND